MKGEFCLEGTTQTKQTHWPISVTISYTCLAPWTVLGMELYGEALVDSHHGNINIFFILGICRRCFSPDESQCCGKKLALHSCTLVPHPGCVCTCLSGGGCTCHRIYFPQHWPHVATCSFYASDAGAAWCDHLAFALCVDPQIVMLSGAWRALHRAPSWCQSCEPSLGQLSHSSRSCTRPSFCKLWQLWNHTVLCKENNKLCLQNEYLATSWNHPRIPWSGLDGVVVVCWKQKIPEWEAASSSRYYHASAMDTSSYWCNINAPN